MMKYRKEIITEEKTKCQRVTQFSGDGSVDKVSEKTETTKNEKTIESHDSPDSTSTKLIPFVSILLKVFIRIILAIFMTMFESFTHLF